MSGPRPAPESCPDIEPELAPTWAGASPRRGVPSGATPGWPPRPRRSPAIFEAIGYAGTGPAGDSQGINPANDPNGSLGSLLYANRVHCTKCLGSRFSTKED